MSFAGVQSSPPSAGFAPASAPAPADFGENAHLQASDSDFRGDSSCSNPQSKIPNPKSDHIPRPRRPVPLVFDPCINDEANIFEAISESHSSIADLAFNYKTTVNAFSMWLMREDVQAKLAAVSAAGACATRIGAVSQLPEVVGAMIMQVRGCITDETHRLNPPGLENDKMQDRRRTTARRAANLLLRLATFDPSRPLYRRRVDSSSPAAANKSSRESHRTTTLRTTDLERESYANDSQFECAPVRELPSVSTSHIQQPTSHIAAPSILDLCSLAMSALASSRFSHLAAEPIHIEPIAPASAADPIEPRAEPPQAARPPSRHPGFITISRGGLDILVPAPPGESPPISASSRAPPAAAAAGR